MTIFEHTPDFGRQKMMPLKALLALMIVADHLTFWVDASWLRPFRELGAPIVSMFLFISGYGLMKSFQKKGEDYLKGFFWKRIWKVILPSLIALAVYWIVCFDASRDYLLALRDLIVYGVPLFPFSWYVVAIVALYLAFYLSFRFLPRRYAGVGVIILSVLYIVLTKSVGYDRCWWVCTLAFPAGLLFAEHEGFINTSLIKTVPASLVVTAVLFTVFAALFMTGSEYAYILCYIFIPVIVTILYSRVKVPFAENRLVVFLGGISYEIYLCQGISMEFLRRFVPSDPVYIVCVYVMTLALAVFVNRVSGILLSKRIK